MNKKSWCSDKFCAKAWFSEHQSWLAIDIFQTTTKEEFLLNDNLKLYFNWLNENAYKYWFHNSYQKGIVIDWYLEEPWHRRYLWKDLAKELLDQKITFWEFIFKLK